MTGNKKKAATMTAFPALTLTTNQKSGSTTESQTPAVKLPLVYLLVNINARGI